MVSSALSVTVTPTAMWKLNHLSRLSVNSVVVALVGRFVACACLFASLALALALALLGPGTGVQVAADLTPRFLIDGMNALSSPSSISLSPDERFLYATSFGSHTLVKFNRDLQSGALSNMSGIDHDFLGPNWVAISNDGKNAYVTNNYGGVFTFQRSVETGDLAFLQQVSGSDVGGNPKCVAISPNDRAVVVTSAAANSVNIFRRSSLDGSISDMISVTLPGSVLHKPGQLTVTERFVTTITSESVVSFTCSYGSTTSARLTLGNASYALDEDPTLRRYSSFAVSPDERFIYVSSYKGFWTFERFLANGTVWGPIFPKMSSYAGTGMAVSSDGLYLYSCFGTDVNSIGVAVWKRTTQTGALTFLSKVTHDGTTINLRTPYAIVLTLNCTNTYAIGKTSNSIVTFNNSDGGVLVPLDSFIPPYPAGVRIDEPWDIAISADGASAYVLARSMNGIFVFARSVESGALVYVSAHYHDGSTINMMKPWAVAVSPGDDSVYVVGSSSISVFDRSLVTGALTNPRFVYDSGVLADGRDIVVAPDGMSVYAVSSYRGTVVTCDRLSTGDLSGVRTIAGIGKPTGLVIAPDGRFVYITDSSDDAIVMYSRSLVTGTLSNATRVHDDGDLIEMDYPAAVAISSDGHSLYVVSQWSDSLVGFQRSRLTGALYNPQSFRNSLSTPLDGALSVDVSNDGYSVYAVAWSSRTVVSWSRDPVTGRLSHPMSSDPITSSGRAHYPSSIISSPDSRFVYVTYSAAYVVAVFQRKPCPSGMFNNVSNPVQCLPCRLPFFQPLTGVITFNCSVCQRGYFVPYTFSALCLPCPPSLLPSTVPALVDMRAFSYDPLVDRCVNSSHVVALLALVVPSVPAPVSFSQGGETAVIRLFFAAPVNVGQSDESVVILQPMQRQRAVDVVIASSFLWTTDEETVVNIPLSPNATLSALAGGSTAYRINLNRLDIFGEARNTDESLSLRSWQPFRAGIVDATANASLVTDWAPSLARARFVGLRDGQSFVLEGAGFFAGSLIEAWYGPVWDPFKYRLVPVPLSVSDDANELLNVTIPIGAVGTNLSVVVAVDGRHTPRFDFASEPMVTLNFARPTLSPGTLRRRGFSPSSSLSIFVSESVSIEVEGSGFGIEAADVAAYLLDVSGRILTECFVDASYLSPSQLRCSIPEHSSVGLDLSLVVIAGNQSSEPSAASINIINRVELFNVSGCSRQIGNATYDCPTQGGIWLTFSGSNFGTPLSCELCSSVVVESRLSFLCLLVAGTGDRISTVVSGPGGIQSEAQPLISYAAPQFISVEGCPATGCNRVGGTRITIIGSNFGAADARVFIGSFGVCSDVVHAAGPLLRHRNLSCTLPAGALIGNPVILVQYRGLATISAEGQSVDYRPCAPGRFASDGGFGRPMCEACPAGTYAGATGNIRCLDCPADHIAPSLATDACIPCGSLAAANHNRTACTCVDGSFRNGTVCDPCPLGFAGLGGKCSRCSSGTFADSTGFHRCKAAILCPVAHIVALSAIGALKCDPCPAESFPDALRHACVCSAGYAMSDRGCEACPLGGDCSNPGAMAGAIIALPGSWASSSAFYSCPLGDKACLGGGFGCAKGYTGVVCAVCADGYFLRNNACVACGASSTTAIAVVFALGLVVIVFVALWLFKNRRSKRRISFSQIGIIVAFVQILSVVPVSHFC